MTKALCLASSLRGGARTLLNEMSDYDSHNYDIKIVGPNVKLRFYFASYFDFFSRTFDPRMMTILHVISVTNIN
jgi:hypothetical protein